MHDARVVLQGHHVRRLEGVVDFVDAHLDAELSLERMATLAAISPFHFHRLFHQWAPLWDRFMSAVRALGLVGRPLMFMGLDDPGIVGPARCRTDACAQLPAVAGAFAGCPPPLLHKRIPARWVATLDYDGPAEDIAEGWRVMLDQWLPQAAFSLAIGPFFERYDPAQGAPGGRNVRCRLGMPVEPRSG